MRKDTIDNLTEFYSAIKQNFLTSTAKAISQGFKDFGSLVDPLAIKSSPVGSIQIDLNVLPPDESLAVTTSILTGIASYDSIRNYFRTLFICGDYSPQLSSIHQLLTQCAFKNLSIHDAPITDTDWQTLYEYIAVTPLESLTVHQNHYQESQLLSLGKLLATNPKLRKIHFNFKNFPISFKGLQQYLHLLGLHNTHLKTFDILVDKNTQLDLVALQLNTLSMIWRESKANF